MIKLLDRILFKFSTVNVVLMLVAAEKQSIETAKKLLLSEEAGFGLVSVNEASYVKKYCCEDWVEVHQG